MFPLRQQSVNGVDKTKRVPVITYQEILSSLEYESKSETSMGSALPLYTSSLPSPPLLLLLPSPIDLLPHYNMSHVNLHEIIRQQQEQLVAMQAQIQALLARGAGRGETAPREVGRSRGAEVAKSQIFDGMTARVAGFILACKLYIRMRLRGESVEGQVQWILSYVQEGSVDKLLSVSHH